MRIATQVAAVTIVEVPTHFCRRDLNQDAMVILQIGQLAASVEEEGGSLASRDEFEGERGRSARLR